MSYALERLKIRICNSKDQGAQPRPDFGSHYYMLVTLELPDTDNKETPVLLLK